MHLSVSLVAICAGAALAAPLHAPQMESPDQGARQGRQIRQGTQTGGSAETGYQSVQDADGTTVETMPGSGMQTVRDGRRTLAQNGPENGLAPGQPGTIEFTKPIEPYENDYSGGPDAGSDYVPTNQGAGKPPRNMLDVNVDQSTDRLRVNQPGTGAISQRLAQIPPYQGCPESKKCEDTMQQMATENCFNRIGQGKLYSQEICNLQLKTAQSGCMAECAAAARERGEDPTVATKPKNSRTAMKQTTRFPDPEARNNAPESIDVTNNNSPLGINAGFILADGGPERSPTGSFQLSSAPIDVPNSESNNMPGSDNELTRPPTNNNNNLNPQPIPRLTRPTINRQAFTRPTRPIPPNNLRGGQQPSRDRSITMPLEGVDQRPVTF